MSVRILAMDSTAVAASSAVVEDEKILAESYSNVRLTHSQTLMPMVESMLRCAEIPLESIDLFAVNAGPGSFTGVRIGVAAVKGLGVGTGKPCVGTSTLEALAFHTQCYPDAVICPVMDARCAQVYNALFRWENGQLIRLCEDRAIAAAQLEQELKNEKCVILLGDGAQMCYNSFTSNAFVLAPEQIRYQRASGVAAAAREAFARGESVDGCQLIPTYLRLPQAERELKKRNEKAAEGNLR